MLGTLQFIVSSKTTNTNMQNSDSILLKEYTRLQQADLDELFIHPDKIPLLIDQIKKVFSGKSEYFQVEKIGESFLKKPVFKISLGNGPINILMWSQMHGNEPSATASLFDLIKYTMSEEKKSWFELWRDEITVHIVPMLNPDGAELNQRENAQGIDINRDAQALQSPEGKLLFSLIEQTKPQFAFNLHSQNRFYTVGNTNKSAVISLLAPAYNDIKETNDSRKNAKQIISMINRAIQNQYPGHVGRYDDTYSYRSFGDLYSAKGISTILIEAGFHKADKQRQIPRWLTFFSLKKSMDAIYSQSYTDEVLGKNSEYSYGSIPFNKDDGQVDLLLKNLTLDSQYTVDIAINQDELFQQGQVIAIGDLSTITGISEVDLSGHQIEKMKGYRLDAPMSLSIETYKKLLRKGYGYFIGDSALLTNKTTLPIIINPSPNTVNCKMEIRHAANFLFSRKKNYVFAIIDGNKINLAQ